MSTEKKLENPPIIEAIIDIDCDMPPEFEVGNHVDQVLETFGKDYPDLKKRYQHSGELAGKLDDPSGLHLSKTSVNIQALLLQHRQEKEKQLIQVRQNGFSFNRLAPYSSLNDYLSEIERTWTLFAENFSPLLVRRIGLRYINRLFLPLENGKLELDDYLNVGPKLPQGSHLKFAGFVHQQKLIDSDTGGMANIVLTTQPEEKGKLPIIFDIGTTKEISFEPTEWKQVEPLIKSLRVLKNHIFFDSITEKCQCLFQ